jgi:hypothetical protein
MVLSSFLYIFEALSRGFVLKDFKSLVFFNFGHLFSNNIRYNTDIDDSPCMAFICTNYDTQCFRLSQKRTLLFQLVLF